LCHNPLYLVLQLSLSFGSVTALNDGGEAAGRIFRFQPP
jgi:hypothetical protein